MRRDGVRDHPDCRLFAIGDVHGCSTALSTLIDAIDPRPEDTIVTLGDYIDWGPDSRGVIDLLIDLSKRCHLFPLLGNHEEMLMDALGSERALRSWLDLGGEETLASYPYEGGEMIPEGHVGFIRGCRDFFEAGTHIFVHANYNARLPLERTGGTRLRWEPLAPESQQPHRSGKRVVVGHSPQVNGEVLDLGFLVCIDTDCSRGGWLTAIEARSGSIVQANQAGRLR